MLGHASAAMTIDTYADLFDDTEPRAHYPAHGHDRRRPDYGAERISEVPASAANSTPSRLAASRLSIVCREPSTRFRDGFSHSLLTRGL